LRTPFAAERGGAGQQREHGFPDLHMSQGCALDLIPTSGVAGHRHGFLHRTAAQRAGDANRVEGSSPIAVSICGNAPEPFAQLSPNLRRPTCCGAANDQTLEEPYRQFERLNPQYYRRGWRVGAAPWRQEWPWCDRHTYACRSGWTRLRALENRGGNAFEVACDAGTACNGAAIKWVRPTDTAGAEPAAGQPLSCGVVQGLK